MHPRNRGRKASLSFRGQPQLRIEQLEQRLLMAGDTYLINFQPLAEAPVTRYLVDGGQVFGARPGGFSYGWSSDHTDQSRLRIDPETGVPFNPDLRFSTLIHFEVGQNWEFQLANGSYDVTVAVGDPAFNDGVQTINVEGVNYWNAVPDPIGSIVKTMTVTVSDGRLTINSGAAANKATRINFVQIVGVPSAANQAPTPPTITEPLFDGKVVSPADVHMEAINFADGDGNAHKSTDWEIWTTGPGAEMVWETKGIEGVERLHTHLGDGIFVNSRAGFTSLVQNAPHELRVRFRDDVGSVGSYAVRQFQTGAANAAFPLELEGIASSPAPVWTDILSANVDLPDGVTFITPSDPIIAIDLDGGSNFPTNESPNLAIDGTTAKYLNFGEVNSGFILTPSNSSRIVTGFRITTANDAEERDPSSYQLYGTNDPITSTQNSTGTAENWALIAGGTLALPAGRNTQGAVVSFANSTAYKSYRMVFTGVKNAATANSMQIGEIAFTTTGGVAGGAASLEVNSSDFATTFLDIEGRTAVGNTVTTAPALMDHADVRVTLRAGSGNLVLRESDLTFNDSHGDPVTIYLPAINLPAGQRLDLWVSSTGATYYGTAAQTAPNFSLLARAATLNVPFIVTQPGYVIEEVGAGYRLPVNIAFVPNPGPLPTDPLYFVSELYGSVQVVTRNGVKHQFASGLLDYNPTGPISGSGEQGLTGIAVERDSVNPDIYNLYVGMLWDNGAAPGGASHYPKVEKLTSATGGLTMASRSVLLNMQPETQGQSHQISNITIGPDGKLYVHNGDGFDASTARNLDQFRGKVLRMNKDGTAPSDNPFYNAGNGITARDYVWAYGLRNPFGGAWRAADGKHYSVENGPSVDRFAQINRGVDYGWNGSDASMFVNAIYNWNPATAPVNITFVQPETFAGSQLPKSVQGQAFISQSGPTYAAGPQSNSKSITQFTLSASGAVTSGPNSLVEYIGSGRSTIAAVAAGPDGLYFSELYEETGANGPTASGARIFRLRYVNTIAGDCDIDGDVDAADYTVWQTSFGSNLLLAADGNGNGVVDAADYTVWRESLPSPVVPTNAVSALVSTAPAASPSSIAVVFTPQVASVFTDSGSIESATVASPVSEDSLLLMLQPFAMDDQPGLESVVDRESTDDESTEAVEECFALLGSGDWWKL